jgi:hypothetical protein
MSSSKWEGIKHLREAAAAKYKVPNSLALG